MMQAKATTSGRILWAAMRAAMSDTLPHDMMFLRHDGRTLTIDGVSAVRIHRVTVEDPDGYGEVFLHASSLKRAVKPSAKSVAIEWDGDSRTATVTADGVASNVDTYGGREPGVASFLEPIEPEETAGRILVNPAFIADAAKACEAVGGHMRMEVPGQFRPMRITSAGRNGSFTGILMPMREERR